MVRNGRVEANVCIVPKSQKWMKANVEQRVYEEGRDLYQTTVL